MYRTGMSLAILSMVDVSVTEMLLENLQIHSKDHLSGMIALWFSILRCFLCFIFESTKFNHLSIVAMLAICELLSILFVARTYSSTHTITRVTGALSLMELFVVLVSIYWNRNNTQWTADTIMTNAKQWMRSKTFRTSTISNNNDGLHEKLLSLGESTPKPPATVTIESFDQLKPSTMPITTMSRLAVKIVEPLCLAMTGTLIYSLTLMVVPKLLGRLLDEYLHFDNPDIDGREDFKETATVLGITLIMFPIFAILQRLMFDLASERCMDTLSNTRNGLDNLGSHELQVREFISDRLPDIFKSVCLGLFSVIFLFRNPLCNRWIQLLLICIVFAMMALTWIYLRCWKIGENHLIQQRRRESKAAWTGWFEVIVALFMLTFIVEAVCDLFRHQYASDVRLSLGGYLSHVLFAISFAHSIMDYTRNLKQMNRGRESMYQLLSNLVQDDSIVSVPSNLC
jgi:hypothetical protein